MFKDSKVFSDKPILVASPPSSGSTLLAVMLDNHPLISCGPETSLMGNPLFYNKPNMLNVYLDLFSAEKIKFNQLNGIVALIHGLAPTGVIYEDHLASYNTNLIKIKRILKNSKSSIEAIEGIYGHRARVKNKKYIAEKTPGNFFAFPSFFKNIPNGKVILITRHPYDQIYSLMKRGYDFSYAACCWISHTARCLRYKNHLNVFLLKFEQLVNNTYNTWKNLFAFLEIEDHANLIENFSTEQWRATNGSYQIETWTSSPNQLPNKSAIGQGVKFLKIEQMLALTQLQAELNAFDDSELQFKETPNRDCKKINFTQLCKDLEYPLIDVPNKFDSDLLADIVKNICLAHKHLDTYNTSNSFPFWEVSLASKDSNILMATRLHNEIKSSFKEKFENRLYMIATGNLKLMSLLQQL
ncbi:MAG: hypothetical protein BGO77_07850 [Caedibacter sp. 37-49]|nr:MAG: hypothetical protein BGO77_07850 [Caedibacter sp. 37-49]